MLPGFSGHLISEQYLEQQLRAHDVAPIGPGFVQALRQWRASQSWLGPSSSLRAMLDAGAAPLTRALGFSAADDLREADSVLGAALRGSAIPVALLVGRYGEPLDPLWRSAVRQACARATHWCLLFNGTHLRLLHVARAASHRFTQFDLDAAADDEYAARALWMLLSAEAFSGLGSEAVARSHVLIEASDRHGTAVCRSLRRGVLDASECVLGAFLARPGGPMVAEAFAQALTLVYRLLFLFFAEARFLVPIWHPVYRDSYGLDRLCDAAASGSAGSVWDALRAVSRLAHTGCHAGDLSVTPFNGRLFAPSRTPLAERAGLDDGAARRALVALSTRPSPDGEGRERIAYRDLGVEQLGAVYETLLDYAPDVQRLPRRGRTRATTTVTLRPGSGARKSTGSFYTPEPIVRYLVRRTLGPLVRDATPERILSLRVLDPSMGSGAFLVGACLFLADAYEAALTRTGGCHASDVGPGERAAIRRTIAERCLYGVDLNPMAVQLARLSLWLATLAADRPLSFLDHHLQIGNSLLGTWLSSLRRPPIGRATRSAALPLFEDAPVEAVLRGALPVRFTLACAPTDTLEQVRSKERALSDLARPDSPLSRWKRIADLWCARWLVPDFSAVAPIFASLSDAILTERSGLPVTTTAPLLARADAATAELRTFHWELEFPEVFFDQDGQRRPDAGFDAVLGNPPWDMLRDDGAAASPALVAPGTAARTVRFTRDSGVYRAEADGQSNCYQLFLDRTIALTRAGGRFGLVLPSGLASDQGSASLRRLLFSTCEVDALVGFNNRRGIFPVHRSLRFLLLSARVGAATREIACRLGELDPASLDAASDDDGVGGGIGEGVSEDAAQPWFPVRVTPRLLARLSGEDMSVPDFRAPIDVAIAERAAARFAPLGSENGWSARFGRELNATEDRDCFSEGTRRAVPVVEGKLIDPFVARIKDARYSISVADATRRLGERHTKPRLAYRDVASAGNRLTLISAILPAGCVSTHTLFCLRSPLSKRAQHFLCGLFNSFVLNYLVRLRVTTHVTTAIVERLPFPTETEAGRAFASVAALARSLARRPNAPAASQLQARVARLYALNDEEFAHIVGTFPLVSAAEREAALRAFRQE